MFVKTRHWCGMKWTRENPPKWQPRPQGFRAVFCNKKEVDHGKEAANFFSDWFRLSLSSSLYGAIQVTRRQDHVVEIWRSWYELENRHEKTDLSIDRHRANKSTKNIFTESNYWVSTHTLLVLKPNKNYESNPKISATARIWCIALVYGIWLYHHYMHFSPKH